ncbi:MAG TPA: hypothetical protein VFP68_04210 [Burkholderiaceae bacterium]|nr:hypothetical protein [Burkholderiaceae bacterium]
MNKDWTDAASRAAPSLDQGDRHFEHRHPPRARRACETAARLARAGGDRYWHALSLHNQGVALYTEGLRNEARHRYEEALAIQKDLAQAFPTEP